MTKNRISSPASRAAAFNKTPQTHFKARGPTPLMKSIARDVAAGQAKAASPGGTAAQRALTPPQPKDDPSVYRNK
jgi:hypothetical protein